MPCVDCAADLPDGAKFCGECGSKQPAEVKIEKCTGCQAELPPNAKFCGECGAKTDAPSDVIDVSPSPVAAVKKQPEVKSSFQDVTRDAAALSTASASSGLATPKSMTAVADASGGTGSAPGTPSSEGESRKSTKKVFSVRASPKCAHCDKVCYATEGCTNSKDDLFHKTCLKCTVCKVSLMGREPVVGAMGKPIAKRQYLKDDELKDAKGLPSLLCEKHAIKRRASAVAGKDKNEIARNDKELSRVSMDVSERVQSVKLSMEVTVGDTSPSCAKCGNPIESNQGVVVNGMERYHEKCPTAEEAETIVRTSRYFAKKLPERLVLTFIVDKSTKHPHTFLYEMDKASFEDAMRAKKHDTLTLRFTPDSNARASVKRKLQVPSAGNREFDLSIRDVTGFTFKNEKKKGKDDRSVPKKPKKVDDDEQPAEESKAENDDENDDEETKDDANEDEFLELALRKWKFSNGVLQSLTARFEYSEEKQHVAPIDVVVQLETWPPPSQAEVEKADPLSALKKQLSEPDPKAASSGGGCCIIA